MCDGLFGWFKTKFEMLIYLNLTVSKIIEHVVSVSMV